VAPVAAQQVQMFVNQANTFDAIVHNQPQDLQQTIEKNPATEQTAIESFRVQRPFLANFADLSRRLRPVARLLPTALPKLNTAFRVGQPVLRRSVDLNEATKKVFVALDDLVQNPNVELGLQDLRTLTSVTAPLLGYVAPFQTVCSYANHFFEGLGGHISEVVQNGTAERVIAKSDNSNTQNGKMGDSAGTRPADVPANQDPTTATDPNDPNHGPLELSHATPYPPAVDARGNANCQSGQFGYIDGPLNPPWSRYHGQYGSFHTQTVSAAPWLAGTTWDGVKNLRDVP
jgi:ABC-type transporter Mla subunit MlaD